MQVADAQPAGSAETKASSFAAAALPEFEAATGVYPSCCLSASHMRGHSTCLSIYLSFLYVRLQGYFLLSNCLGTFAGL